MAPNSVLDPDSRESQDERYNPGQRDFDNLIDSNYSPEEKQKLNNLAEQEQNPGNPAGGSNPGGDAAQKEQAALGVGTIPFTPGGVSQLATGGFSRKKKGIIGAVIGLVAAVGGIGGFIMPSFALVNLKEVAVNKFVKDQLATYEPRAGILMRYKAVPNNAPDTTAGCAIKVKCRFKGVSTRGVEKLRKAGFTVTVDPKPIAGHPFKYNRITSLKYEVDGRLVEVTPDEYKRAIRTNPQFNKMLQQAYKSKVAIYTDRAARKITNKLGIFRGNQLGGATDKRSLTQKIRASIAGRNLDVNGRPIVGGTPETDAQIERNRQQLGSAADEVAAEAQQRAEDFRDPDKVLGSIPDVDGPEVSSVVAAGGKGALKGAILGPMNSVNNICTVYYMIQAVGFGAKVVAAEQLIRYYYTFSNTADAIKAGDATPEQVSRLGSIFSSKDKNGRSLPDSFGYNYMATGKIGDSAETYKYKLGGGVSGSLIGFTSAVNDLGGGKTCGVVSNPFVQAGGFLAYIISVPLTGGGAMAAQTGFSAAAASAIAVAQLIVTPMLINMVAGTLVTGDENGKDAGNAFTAGGGAYASYSARSRALIPQKKPQAAAYDKQAQPILAMAEATDTASADPLDVTNPASPAGKAFARISAYAISPLSTATSTAALQLFTNPLGMFGTILADSGSTASASHPEYEICTDPEYKDLNLATDPFCNPKYGFDLTKLQSEAYNPEKVIDFMVAPRCIWVDAKGNQYGPVDNSGYVNYDGDPQPTECGGFSSVINGVAVTGSGDNQRYVRLLKECIENDKPLSPNDSPDTLPTYCLKESDTPEQVNMRLYTIDTNINDGIREQMDDEKLDAPAQPQPSAPGGQAGGASGSELKSQYANGKIPSDALCDLIPVHPSEKLQCAAATSLKAMSAEYKQRFGKDISVTDGYRSFEDQVRVKREKGNLAATPGKSNHGWGLALDLGGGINKFGTPEHNWMKANAGKYGWVHPPWAQINGSKPEAWHWEYGDQS